MSDTTQNHGHADHDDHHIVPLSVYITIFLALMVGTALTVWVAFIDLGELNIYLALAIAVTKASLVLWYFMHVKYSSKLVQLASVMGFIWLGIFLSFTFADLNTRDWQPLEGWAPQPVNEYDVDGAAAHGGGHGEAAEHAPESH